MGVRVDEAGRDDEAARVDRPASDDPRLRRVAQEDDSVGGEADVGTVESRSRLDGRRMVMVLAPLQTDLQKKQQDTASKKSRKPSPTTAT